MLNTNQTQLAARLLRPSWAEIDLSAIAHNVAQARALIGMDKKIYFVCKGDGFGFGAATVAKAAVAAGVDGLCVGSPEEACSIRSAGVENDILLFASTLPSQANDLARLGVVVTIQSLDALEGFFKISTPVDAFVEVDCGFGRFGIPPRDLDRAFERLSQVHEIRVRGIYGHLSSPEDSDITRVQSGVFDQAIATAAKYGFNDIEKVLASSRVMILHPQLGYTGVDPGRFIYGALDEKLMHQAQLKPLLHAIRGRIIHVQSHPAGTSLGLGYGAQVELDRDMRLGIVPIGFWDGLNHVPPLGRVLINGKTAPVIGRRSFQHTVIDISDAPEAEVGTTVTIMGREKNAEITIDELAETMRIPVMEAIPRLASKLPHRYISEVKSFDVRTPVCG